MVVAKADKDWAAIEAVLPVGWREAAVRTGAITSWDGPLSDPEVLLRLFLGHASSNAPLRATADDARDAGLVDVSHVALHKAFKRSGEWLEWLVDEFLNATLRELPTASLRLRLVDATCASRPGSEGTDFRLHVSVSLPERRFTQAELTEVKGGETFTRFEVQPDDLFVGDRAYGTSAGVAHVDRCGGYVLVRINGSSLPLYGSHGERLDPLKLARGLKPGQNQEWHVEVRPQGSGAVLGRLCIHALSDEDAERAEQRVLRQKKYRGGKSRKLKTRAIESAKYVFVFTTLGKTVATTAQVLAIYRLRWQVELAFKMLKTVLKFGRLPNQLQRTSRTWLLAKLLCALVTERLAASRRAFSPDRAAA